MTKNNIKPVTACYTALTGRNSDGWIYSTQGVAIGLYYVAPSGRFDKTG
ncbi:hypothetical protein [Dysgonomonas sp. 521]|nr:hypothetical protein [Dysgonomonas sp. 521]